MLCPLTKENCRESNKNDSGCQWWIILKLDGSDVGKCSFAWLPILLIELRQALPQKSQPKRKSGNKK